MVLITRLDKSMKKLIATFIIFILSFSSFASDSLTYVRLDYGLGQFSNTQFESLNTQPEGSTIGASIGSKMSYVELGLFYRVTKLMADINHDGAANRVIHNGKSYGVDMNVFLNRHLSLKLGYAFNSYQENLDSPVSAQTAKAIKSSYGLEENYSKSSIFYGANLDIFGAKIFDFYTSVLHFPMGDNKSTTTLQAGIRLYMDLSLADFFGGH